MLLYTKLLKNMDSRLLILYSIKTGEKRVVIENAEVGVLSPDNKRVAFIRKMDGLADVYVCNLDGTGLKQLTFDGGVKSYLAWSPKQ